ncbi:MAG: hypothetical protein RJA49_3085 [Actinomycetota bacterium]
MNDPRSALRTSVARLRATLSDLSADDLARQAYPTEWTVSDVVSHLGSGAIIMRAATLAAADGNTVPADFNQSVWDEWNAKPSEARRAEMLAADQAYLDALDGLTAEQQSAFQVSMGPMQLDLPTFVGMRLNEHTLHSWDIAVTFDPTATLPADVTEVVIDNLGMVGRWAGKPDGVDRDVVVRTVAPARSFAVATTADSVSVGPADPEAAADLELPAEAFIRLLYGRLDPAHTPAGLDNDAVLAGLRAVFTGV